MFDEPYKSSAEIQPVAHTRSGLAAALDDDASQHDHDDSVQAVQSDDANSSNVDTEACKTSERRGKGGVQHHENNREWGVRKIVGQRRTESGGREFRVVWEDSWIEESDLEGAKKLLREFKTKTQP